MLRGETRRSQLWLEGKAAPLTGGICCASSNESHMGYHSAERGCWRIPPLQPSVCRLHLDKLHIIIYPLMTALGSECTVVFLSTLLMSDTSKLALMPSQKLWPLQGGVNNIFTFVRGTKTQLSPCASLICWWQVSNTHDTLI